MQQYVTWDKLQINDNYYIHPTYNYNLQYPELSFTETGYNSGLSLYLGYITGFTGTVNESVTYFSVFNIGTMTPSVAVDTLNEWYPSGVQGQDDFELDADGWTIIDNRS